MLVEKRKKGTSEIPVASMADIAFLLLTFFLVTTTIDVDKGIGLTLPPKGETKEVPKKNICSVSINQQGQVLLAKELVEIPMIEDIVRQKLAANDKLIISLKTHKETKYSVFVAVLDQLKSANAERISIAEPEG